MASSQKNDDIWGADEIRQNARSWSLENDGKLLKFLQGISENLENRAVNTRKKLNDMQLNLDFAEVAFGVVANKLEALQHSQFVENRVYEDDETIANFAEVPVPEEVEHPEDPAKVLQTVMDGLVAKLDNNYETVTFDANDIEDSDDEDGAVAKSYAYRPKDPFENRPLPYLINSKEWHEKWHIGICESDEEYSDEENADEYSISSENPSISSSLPSGAPTSESECSVWGLHSNSITPKRQPNLFQPPSDEEISTHTSASKVSSNDHRKAIPGYKNMMPHDTNAERYYIHKPRQTDLFAHSSDEESDRRAGPSRQIAQSQPQIQPQPRPRQFSQPQVQRDPGFINDEPPEFDEVDKRTKAPVNLFESDEEDYVQHAEVKHAPQPKTHAEVKVEIKPNPVRTRTVNLFDDDDFDSFMKELDSKTAERSKSSKAKNLFDEDEENDNDDGPLFVKNPPSVSQPKVDVFQLPPQLPPEIKSRTTPVSAPRAPVPVKEPLPKPTKKINLFESDDDDFDEKPPLPSKTVEKQPLFQNAPPEDDFSKEIFTKKAETKPKPQKTAFSKLFDDDSEDDFDSLFGKPSMSKKNESDLFEKPKKNEPEIVENKVAGGNSTNSKANQNDNKIPDRQPVPVSSLITRNLFDDDDGEEDQFVDIQKSVLDEEKPPADVGVVKRDLFNEDEDLESEDFVEKSPIVQQNIFKPVEVEKTRNIEEKLNFRKSESVSDTTEGNVFKQNVADDLNSIIISKNAEKSLFNDEKNESDFLDSIGSEKAKDFQSTGDLMPISSNLFQSEVKNAPKNTEKNVFSPEIPSKYLIFDDNEKEKGESDHEPEIVKEKSPESISKSIFDSKLLFESPDNIFDHDLNSGDQESVKGEKEVIVSNEKTLNIKRGNENIEKNRQSDRGQDVKVMEDEKEAQLKDEGVDHVEDENSDQKTTQEIVEEELNPFSEENFQETPPPAQQYQNTPEVDQSKNKLLFSLFDDTPPEDDLFGGIPEPMKRNESSPNLSEKGVEDEFVVTRKKSTENPPNSQLMSLFDDTPPEDEDFQPPTTSKRLHTIFYDDFNETIIPSKTDLNPSPNFLFTDEPPPDFCGDPGNVSEKLLEKSDETLETSEKPKKETENPGKLVEKVEKSIKKAEKSEKSKKSTENSKKTLETSEKLSEKSPESPTKIVADVEKGKLSQTISQLKANAQIEENKLPKGVPRKLATNLNINVAALLPGAKRPTISTSKSTEESPEKSEQPPAAIFTPHISKFENVDATPRNIESNDNPERLSSLNKTRPKIQSRRKPSTRKARQDNYRKSLVDQDECSDDEDSNFKSLEAKKQIYTPSVSNEPQQSPVASSFADVSTKRTLNFFVDQMDSEIVKQIPPEVDKDEEEEDDWLTSAMKEDSLAKLVTPIVAKAQMNPTPIRSKKSIFDDDEDDDDLFGASNKPTSGKIPTIQSQRKAEPPQDYPKISALEPEFPKVRRPAEKPTEKLMEKKSMERPTTTARSSSLFDTDDEDGNNSELFGSMAKKTTVTKSIRSSDTNTRKGLFDDDDDDDDIFGSKSSTAKLTHSEKSKPGAKHTKPREKKKPNAEDSVEDNPLADLLG